MWFFETGFCQLCSIMFMHVVVCFSSSWHCIAEWYSILYIEDILFFECESWTIKKAESWKIHAFLLWCWRRLLRVPWTARKSNQSILKEINPEYSLEGLMLKLKLQYFGYLMWRADSLEKSLMLGKIKGPRRKGQQSMRWLDSINDWRDMNLCEIWDFVKDRWACCVVVHGLKKSRTQLRDWTTTTAMRSFSGCP